MGRPPIPIGAHGEITVKAVVLKNGRTVHEARCRFRAADGSLRKLKRVRPSEAKVRAAVKAAVVELANEVSGGEISPDTRIRVLAEAWLRTVELDVQDRGRSPKTLDHYRKCLRNHVLPGLGELRCREWRTDRTERYFIAKREAGTKPPTLSSIRTVLGNLAAYGMRNGALQENPVRDTTRTTRSTPEVRALDPEERAELLTKLQADPTAVDQGVPDIVLGLLSVGMRLAELLACAKEDWTTDDQGRPVLKLEHRLTALDNEPVQRLARRPEGTTKGKPEIKVVAPWAVSMFRRRALAAMPTGPLFSDPYGGWLRPGTVGSQLSRAFDRAGYGWVTSKIMRKTVGLALREAGMSVKDIADQLGHATTAVTERHYIPRAASNAQQAEALGGMW